MDWRRGRDPREASTQAEDGSPGCATNPALATRGSVPADLGAELGKPGSAATAVAPAPHGAGAHQDYEPTASRGAQRRTALQEEVVAGTRTAATGIIPVGSLGQPAATRSVGVDGSAEPDHRGTNPGDRAGSREVSGGAAAEDASRSRCLDRTGLRADHRQSRALWLGQAGGELSRSGAAGRFQWEPATAGAYHQTGEFDVALPAGGSGPGDGAQPAGVAQQVSPPDDATRTEDRQGRDGSQASGPFVLDDAPGVGLSAVEQVRFARGTARKSPWCAEEHRVIDWASRSSSRRSSK